MIRSPLRYPGGKTRVAEKISELIPAFDEFREPFVGGGSIFINLKQKFPGGKFWINDKYAELAIFWRELQNNSQNLIEQIRIWRNEFCDGKTLYKFLRENKDKFNQLQVAAAFFIFNRITFSGTTEAGGFSLQAFEKRFTDSSIERLKKLPLILTEIKITDFDCEKVISANGKNVFLFLDPPYFSATPSALYGKNGNLHKSFDHERLAAILKKCPHRWLLTYDDSPIIHKLFSFARITDWELTYGMRNVTKDSNQNARELFIANYDIKFASKKRNKFSFVT